MNKPDRIERVDSSRSAGFPLFWVKVVDSDGWALFRAGASTAKEAERELRELLKREEESARETLENVQKARKLMGVAK